MATTVFVILASAVLFMAVILSLTQKGSRYQTFLSYLIIAAGIGGFFFYGSGYAAVIANLPLAIIRSILSVLSMFIGRNDFSDIAMTPVLSSSFAQSLFWLCHFAALYAFASAVIVSLGAGALARLRMLLSRRGHLHILYGVNEMTLALGKQLHSVKENSVLYIGEATTSEADRIRSLGSVVACNSLSTDPTEKLLRRLGVHGGRKVTLYALSTVSSRDIVFSAKFMDAMKEIGCDPDDTRLVISGYEDELASRFQVYGEEHYGFGNVMVFDPIALTARELFRSVTPASTMKFDENGKALEDFDGLILGFGQTGQQVLHQMILNGQFDGSTFHADVFAVDCDSVSGNMLHRCPGLLKNYDVRFHNTNAMSPEFYDYLTARHAGLNYIVLCCTDPTNSEISREISLFLKRLDHTMPIYSIADGAITCKYPGDGLVKVWNLYESDILISEKTDRLAMAYNHYYCRDNKKSMNENWRNCDSFSRNSSRAAADFMSSLLCSVGLTEDDALEHGLSLTEAQLESLARSEHLRWCAFHHMNGFTTMTEDEFNKRAEIYLKEKTENGKTKYRISKNMKDLTHACLIPWEELPALGEKENAITGGHTDYCESDRKNILVIPEALQIAKEAAL